jgi:hypothetical protein
MGAQAYIEKLPNQNPFKEYLNIRKQTIVQAKQKKNEKKQVIVTI